jgi:hypothetical protein
VKKRHNQHLGKENEVFSEAGIETSVSVKVGKFLEEVIDSSKEGLSSMQLVIF